MSYLSDERRWFSRLSPTLRGDIFGGPDCIYLRAEYRARLSIETLAPKSYFVAPP
jgi:hypothetical protein